MNRLQENIMRATMGEVAVDRDPAHEKSQGLGLPEPILLIHFTEAGGPQLVTREAR